jgi:hypothetical protein
MLIHRRTALILLAGLAGSPNVALGCRRARFRRRLNVQTTTIVAESGSTWEIMFQRVQCLVRTSRSWDSLLKRLIAFARAKPDLFDTSYWHRVEHHSFSPAIRTIREWSKSAWQGLGPKSGWEILRLELGDCPEVFELGTFQDQDKLSETKVRGLLTRKSKVLECDEFAQCFTSSVEAPFSFLKTIGLAHNVEELNDSLLSWNVQGVDYHGNDGYLLWLALGTFAALEPLHDECYRRRILQGRDRIHLVSGFEEIMFYVATVTPCGLRYLMPSHPSKRHGAAR